MMSAVTEEDKWGNHWLAKTRSVNKIDAQSRWQWHWGRQWQWKLARVSPWDDPSFSLVNA
jgi:hypothetical protein